MSGGRCVFRDSEFAVSFRKLASPSRQSRSVHYSHNMFMYMGMPALLLPAEAGRLLLASRAALEPSVRSTEVAGLEHLRRRGGGPEARVVFLSRAPGGGGATSPLCLRPTTMMALCSSLKTPEVWPNIT